MTSETRIGRRQGDGEFTKEATDNAAHQQDGDEDGDQRDTDRHDGKAHFPCAFEGGVNGFHAPLYMAHDVFQHDDRVVHHKAGGDRQSHEREIVQRKVGQIHDRECPDKRDGDGNGRNRCRPPVPQEQENDQNDERDGNDQRGFNFPQRTADRRRPVHDEVQVDRFRNGGTQLRHDLIDASDGFDDVGTRFAEDDQHDAGLVADPSRHCAGRARNR